MLIARDHAKDLARQTVTVDGRGEPAADLLPEPHTGPR
jgi:hypothetical protein